jgi:hypothetical protein
MFKICTTDDFVSESSSERGPAVYGKIVIDDFQETFAASLAYWTRDDYALHWTKALARLAAGGDRSALITDYLEPPVRPSSEDYLVWWPLYREGDAVYVQNHILFFGKLDRPFSPERPWDSVRSRQIVNGDGQNISEWTTTIQDIKYFLTGCELT